jgi:hypothetical protein
VIHFGFIAAVLVTAALFALLEIQIEGKQGWATGLPTWRLENRWTRRFLGARAITGYHVYFHLLLLALVHMPFAVGLVAPSWQAELRILAFLALFWVFEDYLWFALNPAYGARKFTRQHAWWHAPNWWWIMPRDYWIFLPVGAGLYLLSLAAPL